MKSPPIENMLLIKGAKRRIFRLICQEILAKKWGILIKKESGNLDFTGLKIPRDYYKKREVIALFIADFPKNQGFC